MQYPFVLKIGPITISTLGVFLFIAFTLTAFSLYRQAKEEHLPEEICFDLLFLNLFTALIGARLLYIIHFWSDFGFNLISFLQFWQKPGLIYWGAVIAVFLTTYLYSRHHQFNLFKMLDNFVFAVIIFKFFTVLGLFFDGSYVGMTQTIVLGGKELQFHHLPALYELVLLIIVYFLMQKISREYRTYSWYQGKKGESNPGLMALFFVIIYSLMRIMLAFVKTYSLYLKKVDIYWSVLFIVISGLIIYFRSGLFDEGIWTEFLSKISLKSQNKNKKNSNRKPYRSPIKAGKDARK